MTYVLFAGDMLVMAFMIGLVIWVSLYARDSDIDAVARLPLDDEERQDG
jgi:hypothetical protein